MVILKDVSEASSSTTATHDYMYDVFISFRGADTRLSFITHLYKALVNANLATFLDDKEIDTGLILKPELESAIRASRASIIVLSKDYASSTWCLNELVLILEQLRNSNHIVIPVFYHVDPTDVRKQQNSFKDSMKKHKHRMKKESSAKIKSEWAQKIEIWNKALIQVADLKGKDAKGRLETEFIEEIVDAIYRRLGKPLRKTLPLLIGTEDSVNFISSWLKDKSSHTTDILTIFGMGGIGKTTLANYLYKLHSREFDESYFIENISRRCTQQFNGLFNVQKQLCSDISNHCPNVLECTSLIETKLKRKRLFLVLDDIDSLEQLDALLGKEGFHPGSKIIITTKDSSLTERCELFNVQVQSKHKPHFLGGLEENKSMNLLCHHAFMCNNPKKGYEEVSKALVKYCEGHPLALEVLGRSLRNRDVAYWKDCVEGLNKESNSHINNVVKMSYDTLGSDFDKELFKHIACFFVGKDIDFTEKILKACNFNTTTGITHLVDRCLLSIGFDNKLTMHTLIQMMGRDVVRQESPNMPWKRSRLWCHEESFKVLRQKKGNGNLQGLTLDMKMLEKEKFFELKSDSLSGMDNLMLLQLNYVQMNDQSYENFPEELRWLCMHGFSLKCIPSELPMENLVVLDMSHSNIESFGMNSSNTHKRSEREKLLSVSCSKDKRLLRSLKILDMSFSEQLHSLGGFFEVPALERLILKNCTSLIHVCESIGHCVELLLIDLSSCCKLKQLPRTIGNLKKVKTLLVNCSGLVYFPAEMTDMDSLQALDANSIGINSQLFLSNKCFPSSLVKLSLKYNNLSTKSFPMNFSSLYMLKELYLNGNPIVSMPNCIRSLNRLEILDMGNCRMLKTVEHPPHSLRKLKLKFLDALQKISFVPEMSPLNLNMNLFSLANFSSEIEGIVKIQDLADVADTVLCSLGWTGLASVKEQHVTTTHFRRGVHVYRIQMYYEFGIFSTIYGGELMPNWIRHRSEGPSISITIPSFPKKLTGLNFCYIQSKSELGEITINNETKNLTWIYAHYLGDCASGKYLTFLSHWMFGRNQMENGDQVTVSIAYTSGNSDGIRECGVGLVYEDAKNEKEEDPLSYYKSWNHIIGGDLSDFRTTPGEYLLLNSRFFFTRSYMGNRYPPGAGLQEVIRFRAFSQKKSDKLGGGHVSISSSDVIRFRALSQKNSDELGGAIESSAVTFSVRPEVLPQNHSTSDSSKSNSSNGELATTGYDSAPPTVPQSAPQVVHESSIIKKAGSVLEILLDVLDAIDTRYPEQAKDEFTLDLVEQCTFHKQQVMHLAVTSRDEMTIFQAVELNEQLQRALSGHDSLVSGRSLTPLAQIDLEEEEEDPEQLFRSITKNAGLALEVLRDVLDAIDTRYPEKAKDELTLDLVEQCSFHKEQVMHVAATSRDEMTLSQAVELNEQLQKALSRHDFLVSGRSLIPSAHIYQEEAEEEDPGQLFRRDEETIFQAVQLDEQLQRALARHDSLVSGRSLTPLAQIDQEEAEEEDPEQLFRRIRKGKACARPEAENHQTKRPLGLLELSVPPDSLNRQLIRPISVEPKQEPTPTRPAVAAPSPALAHAGAASIPPPPANHVEREKFFQENKDGSGLGGHMRGLSLHSRNSSHSDSFDLSD